jgi:hypothetical protein
LVGGKPEWSDIMRKFIFPYVHLPSEFVRLLKSSLSLTNSAAPVLDVLRPNKALYSVLKNSFMEFDERKNLEKILLALGWPNFRDRMASLYIHKIIYGAYPSRTNIELVEEISATENRFRDFSVNSYSRLFLLGFYLKLANFQIQASEEFESDPLVIPAELEKILQFSRGRSERIDWLIIVIIHLLNDLGVDTICENLKSGLKFDDFFQMLTNDSKELMAKNLLAYGASIQEPDFFLYDKV